MVAAIMGGKLAQRKWGDSPGGRAMHSILGPSLSQLKEDPIQILPMLGGMPWINGIIGSKVSIEEDPEWYPLVKGTYN